MANRKTHEQFVQELAEKSPHISVQSGYVNARTKIMANDSRCECDSWLVDPDKLLQGQGCGNCRAARLMSHDDFVKKLAAVSPEVTVLGKYAGNKTKILITGNNCECDSWETTPQVLLRGVSCRLCPKVANNRLSHVEFERRLKIKNQSIEVIGEYVGRNTKILVNDRRCGCKSFKGWPFDLLGGAGCPSKACRVVRINRSKRSKFGKMFHEMMQSSYPHMEVVTDYQSARTPVVFNCKSCDCSPFERLPMTISDRGFECPRCNCSNGEQAIRRYLISRSILFEAEKTFDTCRNKHPLRFDFYVESHNVLIEANGEQHYRSVDFFGGQKAFELTQKRDAIKESWAHQNNYKFLKIRIEKEDVTQSLDAMFI